MHTVNETVSEDRCIPPINPSVKERGALGLLYAFVTTLKSQIPYTTLNSEMLESSLFRFNYYQRTYRYQYCFSDSHSRPLPLLDP